MRKSTRIKSMINHCVKVFNNNRDIDVIEPDDYEDDGEYCLIRSKRNAGKSKKNR